MTTFKDTIRISVDVRPTWTKWTQHVLTILFLVIAPIATGWAVGSSAMQWVGFVFGMLTMFAVALAKNNKHTHKQFVSAVLDLQIAARSHGRPDPVEACRLGNNMNTVEPVENNHAD
jgi:hypothetical protein